MSLFFKIQTDDVSHLLLLNKRNTGVEPSLFASELEKFRPYQQRLVTCSQHQQTALQEITSLWKALKDLAGRGPGAQKWEERERRKKDTIRRFSRARDVYMEVRDGLAYVLRRYCQRLRLSLYTGRDFNFTPSLPSLVARWHLKLGTSLIIEDGSEILWRADLKSREGYHQRPRQRLPSILRWLRNLPAHHHHRRITLHKI